MFSLAGSPAGSGHATPAWGRPSAGLPGGTVHSTGAEPQLGVGDPFNPGGPPKEERGRATVMRLPQMFQGVGSGAATPLRSDGGTLPPSYGGTAPNSYAGTDAGGPSNTAVNSAAASATDTATPQQGPPKVHHNLPSPSKHGLMQHALSVATMALVPWAQFVAVAVAFMFQGGLRTFATWTVVSLSLLVSALACIVSKTRATGPIYMYVSFLGLEATISGAIFGTAMYGMYTSQYLSLQTRATYANVPPTASALSREDGGTISFTAETQLDLNRVLGHMDGKNVYCVAPIVDDSMATEVNFWAVGKDCCHQRSNFDCGDARDSVAKAGLVYQDSSQWFAPHDRAKYAAAARQAAATYSLAIPDEPVFLTWARDPESTEEALWDQGTLWLFITISLYLVGSIITAALLHTLSRPDLP